MVNYQDGKIFMLRSEHIAKVYIGCTCKKYLSQVLAKMCYDYNEYIKNPNEENEKDYYEILGYGKYHIQLIANYSCNNKQELQEECNKYINYYYCCNEPKIYIPSSEKYITKYKDILKNKYIQNKDFYNEKSKKYYEKNKESILQKHKLLKLNEKNRKLNMLLFNELPFNNDF